MNKCCVFDNGEKSYLQSKNFAFLKSYGTIPTPNEGHRSLLKCKKCNGLFLYQIFEWNVSDGDYCYSDFIQVDSEEEADRLNQELAWNCFSSATNPMIMDSSSEGVSFRNV